MQKPPPNPRNHEKRKDKGFLKLLQKLLTFFFLFWLAICLDALSMEILGRVLSSSFNFNFSSVFGSEQVDGVLSSGKCSSFGYYSDSVWAATELITYEAPYSSSFICPPWVTAIYVLFAMCLNY